MPTEYSKLSYRHQVYLGALLGLWLFSFPLKGAPYQLSIYLIPISILLVQKTRNALFREYKHIIVYSTLGLVLFVFTRELLQLAEGDYQISKDSFEIFWRLCLLPPSLALTVQLLRIKFRTLTTFILCSAVIYAISGVLEHDLSFFTTKWNSRMSGVMANPNPFGALLAMAWIICFAKLIKTNTLAQLVLWLAVLILLSHCWVASGARSAWLGGIAALVLFIILERNRLINHQFSKLQLIALPLALAMVFIVLLYSNSDIILSRLDTQLESEQRIDIWQHYIQQLKGRLMFGQPIALYQKFPEVSGPHNTYLNITLRAGIVGLIGFMAYFAFIVATALQNRSYQSSLGLSLLLLLAVYCFFNSELFGSELSQGIYGFAIVFIYGFNKGNSEEQIS
ncbi:MAG: O-antigen ligase family protein [Cellvibrionaceae bacterium]|nr:O-antigen ligase family protein [Cellvibrionaceae bacterium]